MSKIIKIKKETNEIKENKLKEKYIKVTKQNLFVRKVNKIVKPLTNLTKRWKRYQLPKLEIKQMFL